MRRRLFNVEVIFPKLNDESASFPGWPNCAWLNRLKNSARKSRAVPSRKGRGKCLMAEKSVFTKSGPYTGARGEFPSSPGAASAKHCVLKKRSRVGLLAFGAQIRSGRFKLFPLLVKFTPDALLLAMRNTGKPDVIFSITLTCQFPAIALATPFQLPPKRLPLPKGRS